MAFQHQVGSGAGTGYVYDPLFLKHTLQPHPENATRLEVILQWLQSTGLIESLTKIKSRPATHDELCLIHTESHVETVQAMCQGDLGFLDGDTYTTPFSYEAAALAVGSTIDLAFAVTTRQLKNGIALLRPPGHHACRNAAMGFCIFNNIAIAARAVLHRGDCKRIAIVDFDVHHGNGTQEAFETDAAVLFISTHQYPLYPGSGSAREIGYGAGEGVTINIPLPPKTGDEGFRKIYESIVVPALQRFEPELILVSAGYDCHYLDPLAGLGLSLSGLSWISQTLVQQANELCGGKIVFFLEGGYDFVVLEHGVANTVKSLLGRHDYTDPFEPKNNEEPDIERFIQQLKGIHKLR